MIRISNGKVLSLFMKSTPRLKSSAVSTQGMQYNYAWSQL